MSDDVVKISAFSSLAKNLQDRQIEVTVEELDSLFSDTLSANSSESIDAKVFAQVISEKYCISPDDDVLEEIYKLASIDGINTDLSIDDINVFQYIENLLSNDTQTQEAIAGILENIINSQQESLDSTRENNGVIAAGWDWIKNQTGIGAGSNKVQAEIDNLRQQVTNLETNSYSDLREVYKTVTGNELNTEEFIKLCSGEVDFSKSKVINSVNKYQQGQGQAVDTISTIGSALTVVGLVSAGIVAAPFTGGMSLGASFAALGTLTAAGTAAYMVPQAIDGLSEKDGYSGKEIAEDLTSGVINSAITTTGVGVGKTLAKGLTAKAATQFGKAAAGLAASEATSLIMGDGIAIGEYLKEVAFNDEIEFSWSELAKTAASATAASLVAGATAFGTTSTLRPLLTSGSSPTSQVFGRILSSGISGAAAGGSASAAAGSTSYLLSCAIDGKEATLDEWIEATTENIGTGTLTGVLSGTAFEAVQIAAGAAKPENTVKVQKGTTQDGVSYTDYLDKDGNVIARDFKAKDLVATGEKVSSNTRIVRITFEPQGTQTSQQYDWADNITNTTKVITPEIENEILKLAEELSNEYTNNIDTVRTDAQEEFGNLSSTEELSARGKSADSIAAKLRAKYEKGALVIDLNNQSANLEAARIIVADAYGTRLQMKSLTQAEAISVIQEVCGNDVTLEDFGRAMNEYMQTGNIDSKYLNALNALKEAQNAQTFNQLLNDVKNGRINITEINNYGNEISSYFTDRQIIELADAYYQANNGERTLKIVTKDDLNNSTTFTYEQMQQLVDNGETNFLSGFDIEKSTSAVKASGYTSCQMNVEYDLNSTKGYGELQIRGTSVNAFGDVEHIPYDIRQGKITETDTAYSDVYSTIKNMSAESYKVYNEYLTATYDYLRLQELGINIAKPELSMDLTYSTGTVIPSSQIQMITQEGLIQVSQSVHAH